MRTIKKFVRRIGHRGAFLLFLSLLDFFFASSLIWDEGIYSHYHFILPLHLWTAIWLIVGILLFIGAFFRKDRFFYAIAALLKAMWAAGWVDVMLHNDVSRGWAQVLVWSAFAGLVLIVSSWPEVHSRWTDLE